MVNPCIPFLESTSSSENWFSPLIFHACPLMVNWEKYSQFQIPDEGFTYADTCWAGQEMRTAGCEKNMESCTCWRTQAHLEGMTLQLRVKGCF